ncbi:hypothetical protein [Amycolatopsis sp. cmx-4-54]|uniref:hypothetical protein n=1 Tax=Amycolatopsis sp. cmx-4-54 TaxID=2790936 RepID=UPI00397CD8C9
MGGYVGVGVTAVGVVVLGPGLVGFVDVSPGWVTRVTSTWHDCVAGLHSTPPTTLHAESARTSAADAPNSAKMRL